MKHLPRIKQYVLG